MADTGSSLSRLLGRIEGRRLEPDASWINSFGVVFGGVAVAALLDAWEGRLEPGHTLCSAHLAFARPLRSEPVSIDIERPQTGRTISRLAGSVVDGDKVAVEGFAVAADRSGASTAPRPLEGVPGVDDVVETIDGSGRSAAFLAHHFEMRVAQRPSDDSPFVHQWVRLRHLPPSHDGRLPIAAVGLFADLATVGVFRTAVRELEGMWAVKSLDLGVQFTGVPPSTWTLLSIATPPITDGGAIASATLSDVDGVPVARVEQHVLVQPLEG